MKFISFLFCISLLLAACSSDSDFNCDGSPVQFDSNICLSFDSGFLTTDMENDISEIINLAVRNIDRHLEISDLNIRIVNRPNMVISEIGIGGFNPNENEVLMAINPAFPDIESSLEQQFEPLLAHEIHHAMRRRAVGYGSTLFEAMISEGLADQFSVEVSSIEPPIWSTNLSEEDLDRWLEEAKLTWNDTPYDHQGWFFGNGTIPRWAGYSIGFYLVQDYLERNPNRTAAELHNEPAASLLLE